MRIWGLGILGLLLILFATNVHAATFNLTKSAGSFQSGFTLSDLTQTPDRIYPGDQARLRFNIENSGTETANNVEVKVLVPFLSQTSNFYLGDMALKEKKDIVLNFNIPNSTKPGTYTIYVYAAGTQGEYAQVSEILLTIYEAQFSNALIATVGEGIKVFAGDTISLPITLDNVGTRDAEDIIIQMQYASGNVLLPIGSDRVFLESVPADGTEALDIKTGINPSADPGYYPITLVISYKIDKVAQPSITQTFGIKVESKTDLLISADTSTASATGTGQSIVVTVANVGDTPVRGVFISADSEGYRFSGVSEKFYGTLNLDDSITMTLSVLPKGNTAGSGNIEISVTYKDSLNIEHIQKKEVEIGAATGFTGTDRSVTLPNGIGTNQRFGRTSQGFTLFGLEPLVIGGIVVLLLAAYFGYKWYRRRKK